MQLMLIFLKMIIDMDVLVSPFSKFNSIPAYEWIPCM